MKRFATRLATGFAAATAASGVLALAACGSSGSSATSNPPASSAPAATSGTAPASSPAQPANSPGSVTVGSADFPENELLADIYGDAMASKGVKVSKHLNIGERGVYLAALKDGSIGFVPEYSGSILAYLDPKSTAKTPSSVFAELKSVAAKQGFTVLPYAAAQDSDTITVTRQTAQQYHLQSIQDLKSVASKLTLGAPAQFRTRPDGIPALKKVYGVQFGNFVPLNAGGISTVQALQKGTVDAADIFSTDPSIVKYHLVSLSDPRSMFAAQNITPMFSSKVLTKPMQDACNAVSKKLDTKALANMVSQVAGGKDADAVAKAWLQQEGLG